MEITRFGAILLLFVGVIIAFAMIPAIASNQAIMTNKNSVVNETQAVSQTSVNNNNVTFVNASTAYTVTNAPTGWKSTECPLTGFTVKNSSGYLLTSTTSVSGNRNYTIDLATGIFSLNNTAQTRETIMGSGADPSGNKTYLTYTYCQDGYITSSGGRTVASLILLFAALGLIGFMIAYSLKEYF